MPNERCTGQGKGTRVHRPPSTITPHIPPIRKCSKVHHTELQQASSVAPGPGDRASGKSGCGVSRSPLITGSPPGFPPQQEPKLKGVPCESQKIRRIPRVLKSS